MPEIFPVPSFPKPLLFLACTVYGAATRYQKEVVAMATHLTKSQLIEQIATANELAKRDVKGVMEALADDRLQRTEEERGVRHSPALQEFVVIKKPATKAREGINPFTGQPTTFKAKPARKIVRARPVKAAKDAV
jgi:nucleoid DNA-binding protein